MLKKFFCFCLLLSSLFSALPVFANLSESRTNEETGYEMVIEDQAGLLDETSSLMDSVWENMDEISQYGNAAILTVSENKESASELAEETYHDAYGKDSGVLCLIDLDNRDIYIFSDGEIYDAITKSIALTITDNSYAYASKGNYEQCLLEMTGEIAAKLEGSEIAQPMRWFSALFLSVLVGLLLTFILAKKMNSTSISEEKAIIDSISVKQRLRDSKKFLVERRISKKKADSDGSGTGSSGGGGGGSSGGGGGHGF